MRKGKITLIISIGLSCFILSMVMFMQFKIINQTDITSIETMREEDLRTTLADLKGKTSEIEQKYEEVQNTLNEYKTKSESNNETADLLKSELDKSNLILGLTDVEGEGITITINEDRNNGQAVTATDLLIIVNALRDGGAEAISINNERIVAMSDIVYINETFVKINGQRILAPYVIKAIGNTTYLESSVSGNGGHVDKLKKSGYSIDIDDKTKKIEIPKYEDEISSKYIN